MHTRNSNSINIIAETAFNHEGDYDYLIELVSLSAKAKVSHIKFQVLINVDEFVSQSSEAYELVKSWCFTQKQWSQVFDYAESLGLKLFIMPLDRKAVELCVRESVEFIEIHSVSFNDNALKDAVKHSLGSKKLVFGLGGRTLREIESIKNDYAEKQLVLMHGFQAFPSELEDVKLARLKYLRELFHGSILGYADHSAPNINDAIYSSIYAYHLGARIFEKHVTLESGRTDSQSALSLNQLEKYVEEIKRFEKIINESKESAFSFNDKEVVYRSRQKKVVALCNIKVGDVFTQNNVTLKMHSENGGIGELESILGVKSRMKYTRGEIVNR